MMPSAGYWIEGLADFFASESVKKDLPSTLEATGCREGWLQGEMFRFFRKRHDAFFVNTAPLTGRTKADICAYDSLKGEKLWMIGELKVLGVTGYQPKSLGVPVAPLARQLEAGAAALLRPPEMARGWGLVADFCRLRDCDAPPRTPRLLVLVLDTREAAEPDQLGTVLMAAEFQRRAVVVGETTDFIAKCWTVPAKRS